jgi:hypothetical protein
LLKLLDLLKRVLQLAASHIQTLNTQYFYSLIDVIGGAVAVGLSCASLQSMGVLGISASPILGVITNVGAATLGSETAE